MNPFMYFFRRCGIPDLQTEYLEYQLIKNWPYELEELAHILRHKYTVDELRELSDTMQEEE